MAAVSNNPWGKPGAWALDAEENEGELLNQHTTTAPDFPSLSAAKTNKKKKPQTISLQEFTSQKTTSYQPNIVLPTAPRERSAEELDRSKFQGGGFRSYGNSRDEYPKREFTPSRSDGVDNWATEKKPSFARSGYFTDSQSRADEVDNWASNKSFVQPRRGGAFDSLTERRGGGVEGSSRPKLNLQPRTKKTGNEETVNKTKGSSPFGDARPREEVLREKGQDWKEIDEKLELVKIKDGNGWRKTELGVHSDTGSENGHVEITENGQAEETEQGDVKI